MTAQPRVPIAITRIAVRSALGDSLDETVDRLLREEVGIRTPTDLEQTPKRDVGAGEVPTHPTDRGVWRAEMLLRRAMRDLLDAQELQSIDADPTRWAVVIGTTLAGVRHCGVGMRDDEGSRHDAADESFGRTCASSVLAHALRDTGIRGPTITVSCACASALSAVNHACSMLASGEADAIVAGGYDPIAEFSYGGFASLQLVASGPLSPFARDREGMKLGEGVALFVLRRADTLNREALNSPRGWIVMGAETSDAFHLTKPASDGSGAAQALRGALAVSTAERTHPELIVAHATGTDGNDGAEHRAYQSVFGDALPRIPVVALKSRFGHPLGAAGVLEVAAAIGCAERNFIPSTAGKGIDRASFDDLDLVEGAPRKGSPRDIVVLSAGFGGANAATRIVRGAPTAHPLPTATQARRTVLHVTGIGAVSPAGSGPEALLARMDDPSPWPALSESTLSPLLDGLNTRRLALLPRLMIAAVRDLAARAEITEAELQSTPLIAANWCGAVDFTERYYRDLVREGIDLANPMLFAESVPNIGSAQCSLAFGIRAPTMSVIGRRTAGLEALLLARARLATGEWDRAIIVAADEEHPILTRTLSRCAARETHLRSGAIAFLLESAAPAHGTAQTTSISSATKKRRQSLFTLGNIICRTHPLSAASAVQEVVVNQRNAAELSPIVTSRSPFDDSIADLSCRPHRFDVAEFGSATVFALMLRAAAMQPCAVYCSDPHGAASSVELLSPTHA